MLPSLIFLVNSWTWFCASMCHMNNKPYTLIMIAYVIVYIFTFIEKKLITQPLGHINLSTT